jgi:hypothetical protein
MNSWFLGPSSKNVGFIWDVIFLGNPLNLI